MNNNKREDNKRKSKQIDFLLRGSVCETTSLQARTAVQKSYFANAMLRLDYERSHTLEVIKSVESSRVKQIPPKTVKHFLITQQLESDWSLNWLN